MTARLDYRWHLRTVMAGRGMFATTDLIGPLAQRGIGLSSSQVYRLVVERPERLSLKVLMALLDILDCSMEDLIEPFAPAGQSAARNKKAAGAETSVGDLRPRRAAFTARCGRDRPRMRRAGGERPGRADHRAGRGGRARAGGGADPRGGHRGGGRPGQVAPPGLGPGRPSRGAGRRQVPGAPGRRRPAPRVAPGRRAVGLAAALRAVRKAAADLPAPRPGLVLRTVRAAGRTVRRVRDGPPGRLPGPGRAAAMLQVPGHRRPRSGHRDLRHHHRAGPSGQPGRGRRRRPPLGSPAFIPAETGLGTGGQPAAADRGGSSGAVAGDPAAGRSAARRRGGRDCPPCLPRLSPGGAHRHAAEWRAGLPDLHRALAHPAVRTLRSPPRACHPR